MDGDNQHLSTIDGTGHAAHDGVLERRQAGAPWRKISRVVDVQSYVV
jgi:hypothetical protein